MVDTDGRCVASSYPTRFRLGDIDWEWSLSYSIQNIHSKANPYMSLQCKETDQVVSESHPGQHHTFTMTPHLINAFV